MTQLFNDDMPFNRLMGVKLTSFKPDRVTARLEMTPGLVGHRAYNRLHGGVISATLDGVGGMAVLAAIGARHMDEPIAQRMQRYAKLGTIDLRIDYLRPGIGDYFELEGEVLRLGSRVASARMAFRGADGTLLSVGSAAYIIS
ncbi:MAG: thioesterase family protein [Comamonadaceae bacterium]|nr:MAG: thioesterase family protein [Comamonadaceae bacterium]